MKSDLKLKIYFKYYQLITIDCNENINVESCIVDLHEIIDCIPKSQAKISTDSQLTVLLTIEFIQRFMITNNIYDAYIILKRVGNMPKSTQDTLTWLKTSAFNCIHLKKYDEAMYYIRDYLNIESSNPDVETLMIFCRNAIICDETLLAAKVIKNAFSLATSNDKFRYKIHYFIGILLRRRNLLEYAIKEFEKAFNLEQSYDTILNLAGCFEQIGEKQKSQRLLIEILKDTFKQTTLDIVHNLAMDEVLQKSDLVLLFNHKIPDKLQYEHLEFLDNLIIYKNSWKIHYCISTYSEV